MPDVRKVAGVAALAVWMSATLVTTSAQAQGAGKTEAELKSACDNPNPPTIGQMDLACKEYKNFVDLELAKSKLALEKSKAALAKEQARAARSLNQSLGR